MGNEVEVNDPPDIRNVRQILLAARGLIAAEEYSVRDAIYAVAPNGEADAAAMKALHDAGIPSTSTVMPLAEVLVLFDKAIGEGSHGNTRASTPSPLTPEAAKTRAERTVAAWETSRGVPINKRDRPHLVDCIAAELMAVTPSPAPLDILLFCPQCGEQHVDEPQLEKGWTNPPHKSHECQFCGVVWRPSDAPTNGVLSIATAGKVDSHVARPRHFKTEQDFNDAIKSAPPSTSAQSTARGVELIARERQRQISVEGWTPEHDATHHRGEMAIAAACYAVKDTDASVSYPDDDPEGSGWPWNVNWWKPKDTVRNLVRAGALIAAEIDREIGAGAELSTPIEE